METGNALNLTVVTLTSPGASSATGVTRISLVVAAAEIEMVIIIIIYIDTYPLSPRLFPGLGFNSALHPFLSILSKVFFYFLPPHSSPLHPICPPSVTRSSSGSSFIHHYQSYSLHLRRNSFLCILLTCPNHLSLDFPPFSQAFFN